MTRVAVLGVDPGRVKAGYALVGADGAVLVQGIVPVEALLERLRAIVAAHRVDLVALGSGTGDPALLERLQALERPVHVVDERETTRYARRLYFDEHPPRGWRRLLPRGLQVPPRPIDDYAAVLIARRLLAAQGGPGADASL